MTSYLPKWPVHCPCDLNPAVSFFFFSLCRDGSLNAPTVAAEDALAKSSFGHLVYFLLAHPASICAPSNPQSNIVFISVTCIRNKSLMSSPSSLAALIGVCIWFFSPFLTQRSKWEYTERGHIVLLTFVLCVFCFFDTFYALNSKRSK